MRKYIRIQNSNSLVTSWKCNKKRIVYKFKGSVFLRAYDLYWKQIDDNNELIL